MLIFRRPADPERFLLARLHVDALATKHSVKDIRSTLQNLPRGLSDTYDEALSRIFEQQEDDAEFARKVLCWVTYAVRPLTMPELKHALAISPDDTEIDEEGCPEEEFILSLCAGLVLHEPRSGLIRLVHYTAQEHLEKSLVFRYPAVHEDITIACLTYISLEELSAGTCKTISEERLRAKKLILLDYAWYVLSSPRTVSLALGIFISSKSSSQADMNSHGNYPSASKLSVTYVKLDMLTQEQ